MDKCGSCSCFDKSQCVKKGYAGDIIETESYIVEMDDLAENGGKCKCGRPCCSHSCGNSCGHSCGQSNCGKKWCH